jgi:hypothetical protein
MQKNGSMVRFLVADHWGIYASQHSFPEKLQIQLPIIPHNAFIVPEEKSSQVAGIPGVTCRKSLRRIQSLNKRPKWPTALRSASSIFMLQPTRSKSSYISVLENNSLKHDFFVYYDIAI